VSQYEDITGPIVPRSIARQHPDYGVGGGMLLVLAGLVAMLVAFFVDTVMSWDLLRPDLPRETRLMLHGEVALAILAYITGYCALARSALFPWVFCGLTAATLLLAGYSIAVVEMGLSTRSPGLFQVTACMLGILLPYVVLSRRVAVTYRRDVGDWRPPGMAPARPANEAVPAVVPATSPVAASQVAATPAPEPAMAAAPPRPEPRVTPKAEPAPEPKAEPKVAPRPAAQDADFDIPPLAAPFIRREKARDPFDALLKDDKADQQDDIFFKNDIPAPAPAAKAAPEAKAEPKAEPKAGSEPKVAARVADADDMPVAPSFDPMFDEPPLPRTAPPVRPAAASPGAGGAGRYDPFGDDLFAPSAAVSPAADPFFAEPVAAAAPPPPGGSVPPPTFAAATPPPVMPPPTMAPPAAPAPPPAAPPPPRPKPASNFDWLSGPSSPPPAAAPPATAPMPPPVAPAPPPAAAPAAAAAPFGAQPFGVPPARVAPPQPAPQPEAASVGEVAPRLYEQLSRLRRIAGTSGQ